MWRRANYIAPRVFMNFRRPCQLRFVELLYRALMGSVIRTELLAASSWLLGKLASLRRE